MDKPPPKVVQNQPSDSDDDMGGPVTVQGTLAPVGKGTLQDTVVGGAAEAKSPFRFATYYQVRTSQRGVVAPKHSLTRCRWV